MLNILDLVFFSLAFMVSFTGFLINNFEKHVPVFVIKSFRYGSFAYRGSGANYLQMTEIPKEYYRHFYSFSSVFSALTLLYAILVYYFECNVNYYIVLILRLIMETNEPAVSVKAVVLALSLLTVQCIRRCYETYCLQVFAKSSKMNLSHYLVGLGHYFGCVIATVGQAPLFCGSQNRDKVIWTDTRTTFLSIPCIAVFLWAWYEQYQSNIIFANMRRDKKTGEVVTEDHGIPRGRVFERISSPHRFCEILLYTVLIILIPTKTFFCIYLWVLSNQIQTAIQAHEWYKKTFKDYPVNRNAIIPNIL
ncbi:polyprenol reductase [Battus philenor]|uniref:polyprenol reductase n=1 Tax=Battus philenor TaxID=42288 RepID=UPI0035D07239